MDSRIYPKTPGTLGLFVAVVALVVAVVVLLVVWGVNEARERDESFTGEARVEGVADEEAEPDLLAALHAAAQDAADAEDGRFQGDTFEVKRIELDLSNPHVTAYRVIVGPKG